MTKDIYSNLLKIYKDKLYKKNIRLNTYEYVKSIIKISLQEYSKMQLNDRLIFNVHLLDDNLENDYLRTDFFEYKRYNKNYLSKGDIRVSSNCDVLISKKLFNTLFSKLCSNIFTVKNGDVIIFKIILDIKSIEKIINLLLIYNKKKEKAYIQK